MSQIPKYNNTKWNNCKSVWPTGRKPHDSFILTDSGVIVQLGQHSFDSEWNGLCIYGDAGYPLRRYLQTPFLGNLAQQQKDFNEVMSKVRVSVE